MATATNGPGLTWRRGAIRRCAAALLALACAPVALGQEEWSESAYVTLVRLSDSSSRVPEQDEIRLSTALVRVRDGDSIESLLAAHGILPDAESFGAVYTLNPGIDPTSIRPGSDVLLPQAAGGEALAAALREGYLVALTLNVEEKQELLNRIETIEGLAAGFVQLDADRFGGGAERDRTVGYVTGSLEFLRSVTTIIREQTRPLDPEMLWQLGMEASLLESLLEGPVRGNRVLTTEDKQRIRLVGESMQFRAEHLRRARGDGEPPPGYPMVQVQVKTLTAGNQEAGGLRIFYTPEALYDTEVAAKSFATTSPVAGFLPEANYRFWAIRPNESGLASEVLSVRVRMPPGGAVMPVELVLVGPR